MQERDGNIVENSAFPVIAHDVTEQFVESITRFTVAVKNANEVLNAMINSLQYRITCHEIADEVLGIYRDSGRGDIKQIEAEQVAMYCFSNLLEMKNVEIAEFFGKSHTTVARAIKKISGLLDVNDEMVTTTINTITTKYNQNNEKANQID